MSVVLSIININKCLSNYFEDDIFEYFTNKYCFEYFLILKEFYPDAVLVAQNNRDHCAALIKDNVYDVTGIKNKEDFFVADSSYVDYIYSFYNRFSLEEHEKVKSMLKGYTGNGQRKGRKLWS